MFRPLSIILFVLFSISSGFTQDSTKWKLPDGAVIRLDKGSVNDIAFSPDGMQFAVSTNVGIWIHDAQTGMEVELIKEPGRRFRKIAFSPYGNTLACSSGISGRGTIQLCDKATGKFHTTLPAPIGIYSLFFSEDGSKLLCAGFFGEVSMWDINNITKPVLISNIRLDFESWRQFWPVALSPDGRFLALTTPDWQTKDYSIKIYDGKSGELLHTLKNHNLPVESLTFSPDSKTLLSEDRYESIRAWNPETGELKSTMYWKDQTMTRKLGYSPKGRFIASAHHDSVRLWHRTTSNEKNGEDAIGNYQIIMELDEHCDYVDKMTFSSDEKTLLTVSIDGTIIAWDTTTGRQRFACTGYLNGIEDVALSETGDTLTAMIRSYNPIGGFQKRRWDTETGDLLFSERYKEFGSLSMRMSPDGNTLITHNDSGNCLLCDISTDTPQLISQFDIEGYRKGGLNLKFAFSSDGRMLAAGGEDFAVHVWDFDEDSRSLNHKFSAKEHTESVWSLEFSPDGKKLASGGYDKLLRIWDVAEGKTLLTLSGHTWRVNSIAFSPDRKILASGSTELFLWDLESGTQIRKIRELKKEIIGDLEFSPDGKLLLIAANDGLKMYNLDEDRIFTLSKDFTNFLKLSTENNTLVSWSWLGNIIIWDWEKVQKKPYNK